MIDPEKYPEDIDESMGLFRSRLTEYTEGERARWWVIKITIRHAATCNPKDLFAELPVEFQEMMLENCNEPILPETELVEIIAGTFNSFRKTETKPVNPEVLASYKREEERQHEVFIRGHNRFYEFLKKTGKIVP